MYHYYDLDINDIEGNNSFRYDWL